MRNYVEVRGESSFRHTSVIVCRQPRFPLNSSDKVLALHTQLDSVQALRGQLEEVLTRIQNMALDLERATKRQRDLGGGNSQTQASGSAGVTVANDV